jgi:hypothetical protein
MHWQRLAWPNNKLNPRTSSWAKSQQFVTTNYCITKMNKFGVAYKILKVKSSKSPLGSGPESPGLLTKVLHKISTLGDWAADMKHPHDGH